MPRDGQLCSAVARSPLPPVLGRQDCVWREAEPHSSLTCKLMSSNRLLPGTFKCRFWGPAEDTPLSVCRAGSYQSRSPQHSLDLFICPATQQAFIEHHRVGETDGGAAAAGAGRDIIALGHVRWTEVLFGRGLASSALSPSLTTSYLQGWGAVSEGLLALSTLL